MFSFLRRTAGVVVWGFVVLFLVACGGDGDRALGTLQPDVSVSAATTTVPSTTVSVPPVVVTTTTVFAGVGGSGAAGVEGGVCPSGARVGEDGDCDAPEGLSVSGEGGEGEVVVLEEPGSVEVCEEEGGVWDEDAGECGPLLVVGEAEPTGSEEPDPVLLEEPEHEQEGGEVPVFSEDLDEALEVAEVLEAGEEELAGEVVSSGEVEGVWWRPGLVDEAVAGVDPYAVGADDWHLIESDATWGTYRFYRFYHNLQENSPEERARFWYVLGSVYSFLLQNHHVLYYPYRFDVAWEEPPDQISVTLTFPLGEVVVVPVVLKGDGWATTWDVEFPSGPPIRPTIPFAEPRFPEEAEALGRGCLPVEGLWEQDQPVSDPCTLEAVQTALEYAFTGPSELRMAAIRDGHVLGDLLAAVDGIEEAFIAGGMSEAGRGVASIETETLEWKGSFAQASMILARFRVVRPVRDLTEEEREAAIRYYEWRVAQGRDVSPDRLRGEFQVGGPGSWDDTLMVRTADGTWRVSYSYFCHRMDHTFPFFPDYVPEHTLRCPDDPTPNFPDSPLLTDRNLSAPNTVLFYRDPRHSHMNEIQWENGRIRISDEYLGVPLS